MIQRYLGNKNSITGPIIQEIARFCNPGDLVCDIFSGTVSMSMALKVNNYRVVSNDISLFSYHFANCYLRNNTIPAFDLAALGIDLQIFEERINALLAEKEGTAGFLFLNNDNNLQNYRTIVCVLLYLESITIEQIQENYRCHYFYNTYTELGDNSFFHSLRGRDGHRRFFTPENGERIDLIMNKIREWHQSQSIDGLCYGLLISIVCESIEKISNTQGTFHAFQHDEYESRALNHLKLLLPPFDDVIATDNQHIIGCQQDSLQFIHEVPEHKLLYVDPPYNFRQYTSYYFMLNLLSSYCDIIDLRTYFANVQFVRGQNMDDDFDSTFCKSDLFIPSLIELLQNANTRYVVLSYYDGRNHKNKGEQREDSGIAQIEEIFKSDIFVPGSYELKAFERTNYQSFHGHSANKCKEFLFIAEKR